MTKKRILLIYPKLGMGGSLVKHVPLSLLYAAVDAIKADFEIDVVDVRLDPGKWKKNLTSKVTCDTIIVGLSVITGAPIKNALDISRWVKAAYPQLMVVWGGPHATFNGQEILADTAIDYVIAGYGSKPLSDLAKHIRGDPDSMPLSSIKGLIYRDGNHINVVPRDNVFEIIDFRDIPYHLLSSQLNRYGQLDSGDQIFPIYSVLGCPYKCAFCSAPAQFRNFKMKYKLLPVKEVVDHIEHVHGEYHATYIYFIDDDSFIDLPHVEAIIDEIQQRNLNIRLGFRGARINEVKRMSDEFLDKLAAAGTNIMHIGAESGSQRILDLIRKNCTVEDIVEVNRKLARHPKIRPAYNWITGLPFETIEDLRKTQILVLRLIEENPHAITFIPNRFSPLPGTELFDIAVQHGYEKPKKLDDWIGVDAEGNYRPPWFTSENVAAMNMMRVAMYFIDNKISKVETGNTLKFNVIRFLSWLYTPIARARMKYGFSSFLIEHYFYRLVSSFYVL